MEFDKTGVVKAVPFSLESLTDFSGSVSGVSVPASGAKIRMLKCFLTVTRAVDWLSPQFAAALASGKSFTKVTIQTASGHVVTLHNTWVVQITKAGFRNPYDPGSPPVGPGMEAVMWECTAPIKVDGVVQYASYNWNGLNS